MKAERDFSEIVFKERTTDVGARTQNINNLAIPIPIKTNISKINKETNKLILLSRNNGKIKTSCFDIPEADIILEKQEKNKVIFFIQVRKFLYKIKSIRKLRQ